MRTRNFSCTRFLAFVILLVPFPCFGASAPKTKLTAFEANPARQRAKVPELYTAQFKAFRSRKNGIVLDARPRQEFANAHIPGSISIDERGLLRLVQDYPDRSTDIVVYSNGPYCDLAGRRANELQDLGYAKLARYQLGLAVWRAFGNPVETTLDGFRRMYAENATVIIDARRRADYAAGTIPAAESVLPGEVAHAAADHRLRYYDHNTRIILFGSNRGEARALADEFARNSYANSSYFGGSYQDLKRAKFFTERKPFSSNLEGLTR